MSDWDDEEFEPDVKQLDEKKVNLQEEIIEEKLNEPKVPKTQPAKPKPKSKQKDPLTSVAADLGRELTEKEKEEIQRKSDLGFAKDLFGTNSIDANSADTSSELSRLSDLTTVEEFRSYGEDLGRNIATRENNSYYLDMLTVLVKVSAANLDANKMRQLSNTVKQMADEKTTAEKKSRIKNAPSKPTMKITQKANAKSNVENLDDYGGAADNYDDFDEDFM